MLFASLRRKSAPAAEPSELPEDGQTPSASVRGRAITIPSISPRKSFSSLLSPAKKERSATPSPEKSGMDALERDLYPEYDASNPDHDPQRASRALTVDKPRRFHRAPSPHPSKGAKTSLTSRLSRMNRGTLSKTHEQSSLSQSPPQKSFLETLADAIKAPTALFYKENKKNPEPQGGVDSCKGKPKRNHSASPKKSVRFRSGNSLIAPKSRSLPIDIPDAPLFVPSGQLGTTPLEQRVNGAPSDPIPTARPSEPEILKSSAESREAIATADPTGIFKDFDWFEEEIPGPATDSPIAPAETEPRVDNPFEDPVDVPDIGTTPTVLDERDNEFQCNTPPRPSSAELSADQDLNAREASTENLIDPGSVSAGALISPREETIQRLGAAAGEDEAHGVSLSWGAGSTLSHLGWAQENLSTGGQTLGSYVSSDAGSPTQPSNSTTPVGRSSDRSVSESQELSSLVVGDSDNQCRRRPAHVDIRKRFRRSTSCSSEHFEQEVLTSEPASPSIKTDGFKAATGTAPTQIADWSCVCDISHIPRPESTWTAELALRGSNKARNQEDISPITMGLQGALPSQLPSPLADLVCGAATEPVASTPSFKLEKNSPKAGIFDTPKLHKSSKRPGGRSTTTKEYVQRTPSPTYIALPRSIHPGTRTRQLPYSDQYGWSPFGERHFMFAAVAFIASSENDFRQLVCQPGGFWQFWNRCDLPQATAPSRDTKGLVLWEIDELLNCIYEERIRVPRTICTPMVEDFKARIRLTFQGKHTPLGKSTSPLAPIIVHRPEETGESFDDSFMTRSGTSLFDSNEPAFSTTMANISELAQGANSSLTQQDLAGLTESSTNISVLTEEEKIAKASKVLESFASGRTSNVSMMARSRLHGSTMCASPDAEIKSKACSPLQSTEQEDATGSGTRTRTTTEESNGSSTSKRAQRGSSDETSKTTCSTPPSEAMEEDEQLCQGII